MTVTERSYHLTGNSDARGEFAHEVGTVRVTMSVLPAQAHEITLHRLAIAKDVVIR